MGGRFNAAAAVLLTAGIALSERYGAGAPDGLRAAAALALVTVVPGWAVARRLRPGDSFAFRLPVAFALSQGAIALLVVLFFYARLPLAALLAPILLFAATALLGRPSAATARGGARRATIVLLAATAGVLIFSTPRAGFRTDADDHIGNTRRMIDHGDVFPGEYFHADRDGVPDPRKGTNHTAFALACILSRTDPTDAYPALWAFTTALTIFAFHALARAVLGGAGASYAATALFLFLFRGGFAGEWFHTAGYPGKAGIALYFIVAALVVDTVTRTPGRRDLGAVALAAAAAAGVHAFAAILSLLGAGALLVGLALHPRHRSRAGTAGLLLVAVVAGTAPLALFRAAETYGPANALHLHRQGALLLPGGLAVIEPWTLWKAAGIAGVFAFLLLPFVGHARGGWGAGETFLVAASILVLFVLANPFVYPFAETGGGYLTRRLTLLAPSSLVIAAVLRRGWEGGKRGATALPAAAAALLALVALLWPVAESHARGPRPGGGKKEELAWRGPLHETARLIPAGATVLTDPVTAYALFADGRAHITCVVDQHSSPNDADAPRRIADTERFLLTGPPPGAADAILARLGADYVLVNELFPADFRTWNAYVRVDSFRACRRRMQDRPGRFTPVPAPAGLFLFRVTGPPAPYEPEAARRDGIAGGPRIDASMPGGVVLLAGRAEGPAVRAGEKLWLTTTWEMARPESDGVPMTLRVRATRLPDDRPPRGRDTWGEFSLGDLDYPSILWKLGDVVTERDRFRVPPSTTPGSYRILVGADPARFFAVRSLGRSADAVRNAWAAVDTIEVTP